MKLLTRIIYIVQAIIGIFLFALYNPLNVGWLNSSIGILLGVTLIGIAGYGFTKELPYKSLPLWMRLVSLGSVLGYVAFSLVLYVVWRNFDFQF